MAELAYDITFGIESTTPGTYETLAGVTDITPPNASIDVVDVTTMSSPDKTREFISGLTDPGTCSIEVLFKAGGTVDEKVRAWRAAGDTRSCQIEWADGFKWTFDAFPTGWSPSMPLGDAQKATLELKVTSSVVGES